MLESMTPRQFAEWMAADRIGALDGDSWMQAGEIAATIHNEMLAISARMGVKVTEKDLHDREMYVPFEMRSEKQPGSEETEDPSIAAFQAAMESRAR